LFIICGNKPEDYSELTPSIAVSGTKHNGNEKTLWSWYLAASNLSAYITTWSP